MAKKTHVKVRLVPESKPNSPFFYYVKKLLNDNQSLNLDESKNRSISGDNLKIKTKLRKILNLAKELKKLK